MSGKKEQQALVEGILRGEHKTLKAFYKKNLPPITQYIIKNSGKPEDAEDVFQDAMVLVYQKLKQEDFKLTSDLSTFVYAVARNIWLSRLRRIHKVTYDSERISDQAILEANIVADIEEHEKYSLFRKYFLKLSDQCQKVLGLFFEGQSMKTIAKETGLSEGHTRKKKFECKKVLLKMIEQDPAYNELKIDSKKK